MASITIRGLEDDLKERLRIQSANHGCSMAAEVRSILSEAIPPVPYQNLALVIRRRFAEIGVDSLPIPPRHDARVGKGFYADFWSMGPSDPEGAVRTALAEEREEK